MNVDDQDKDDVVVTAYEFTTLEKMKKVNFTLASHQSRRKGYDVCSKNQLNVVHTIVLLPIVVVII